MLTSLQSQGIRDQVLHFLNDLRWLFQRASACSSDLDLVQFSTPRFKYLLLFSSKHKWCSLTKTLLDILAKRSLFSDELSEETMEMLAEIHLLNRAVKERADAWSICLYNLLQFALTIPKFTPSCQTSNLLHKRISKSTASSVTN